MSPARTALHGLRATTLVVATLAVGASFDGAVAQSTRKAKHGPAAHPTRPAPDVTATITKPSPPAVSYSSDSRATEIPSPVTLPPASRARMRACGETWRDMKLAGTTGDDDWRDFALKCLVERGPATAAD